MTDVPNCPKCNKPGIPIIYTTPTEEINEWVDKGWCAFGGDIVVGNMPGYECRECSERFGETMPNGDFDVWIGLKWAAELFTHGRKTEAIQMLRENKNLTIKECLDILNKKEIK